MTRLSLRSSAVAVLALALFACSPGVSKEQLAELVQTQRAQEAEIAGLKLEVMKLREQLGTQAAPAPMPPAGQRRDQGVGWLTLTTTPAGYAWVQLPDGKVWGRQTPFERQELPAGHYTFKVRNDGLNWEQKVEVNIRANSVTHVDNVKLAPPGR